MEKDKKLQFKNNLQIFLMIFVPYVCFSSFNASLDIELFSFSVPLLLIVSGVSLILIILLINKGINLKEQENTQFTNGKNTENASEKISSEPILYRISVAGKEIKFSMIFSIIILVLDILLLFTLHIDNTLWKFNSTFELISYIMISISSILAIISIWLSLKSREQEKGKNLILFGIQYLFFLVILPLTYWKYYSRVGFALKQFSMAQSLFLVILIVSCLGMGFSLLSGSKKDQLNILFFTFYFALGNFVFIFGVESDFTFNFAAGLGYYFIKQFIIAILFCSVLGIIAIKFRNSSKIKINLPTIIYGLVIAGSSYAIYIYGDSLILFDPFYSIYNGIVFIVIQVMALIQLFLNSNNLKEKLSNNCNYIKMLYFIELIVIFPLYMDGSSFFYTISIILLGIINFGILFMQPRFKITNNLVALILNLIVFIPNILIRSFSDWTYENVSSFFSKFSAILYCFYGNIDIHHVSNSID